jgi:2-phosphosulfolactate phosphatase
VLCGEKDGLPPEGFAYGNSPSEFSRLDFTGKSVILATANGTRVLAALAEAPALLVGSILNRTAVAEAAVTIARERRLDIAVVCSAAYGGATLVLEDALGAGAIVESALRLPEPPEALDAARFARDAFLAAGDMGAAVRSAYHAADLVKMGFGDDVAYCGRLDVSRLAPVVHKSKDGLLIIESDWAKSLPNTPGLDALSLALLDAGGPGLELAVDWPDVSVRGRLMDLIQPYDLYPYDQAPRGIQISERAKTPTGASGYLRLKMSATLECP